MIVQIYTHSHKQSATHLPVHVPLCVCTSMRERAGRVHDLLVNIQYGCKRNAVICVCT